MDPTQISLMWLIGIIGFLAGAVILLILWIMKSSERRVLTQMTEETKRNNDMIAASAANCQKGIQEAQDNHNRLTRRLEDTIAEIHRDQEVSRKNCRDFVDAMNRQIAEKELIALRTFAEKAELNALKGEHGRNLERIHDKLDKIVENFRREV